MNRRGFLTRAGGGFGAVALSQLLASRGVGGLADPTARAEGPGRLRAGAAGAGPMGAHFPARAKRVIYLFMHGGPSHVDLWDPKPDLLKYAGQPLPESFGTVMTRRAVGKNPLLPPAKGFRPRGRCGTMISDFLPHLGEMADDLCVLRGCHGDSVNHPQSVYQMNTGSILAGKPSMGSWTAYGLGSENRNMPAFVVLPDPGGGLKGGPMAWGSGFLPANFQGTAMRPGPSPVLNLQLPPGVSPEDQRDVLDLAGSLNARHLAERDFDDGLSARIRSYELAFRMQSAAPEMMDISRESAATRRLYGIDEEGTREFGTRCLLARRMIESGVRFVQLYSGDTNGWDAHDNVLENHTRLCAATDKPVAGLLRDLKSRGLLDDTLVIWGGEFGRMPMSESGKGRDHNPWGYSVVLAGGGVKGGMTWGATDAVGLRAVENETHIHDLHATILHLLGLNHEKLTFLHHGREERLTDVAGRVISSILA